MNTIRVCPGCGTQLPPDAPAGLCPPCLLKSGSTILAASTGGPAAPARAVPLPGQPFGGYRIIRLLGQGGMGQVYEAEQTETGRRVALKVISHALGTEQDRKRFLREGRLAASVNHPNVVYIHGSEEIDGAPVITMEFVTGGTLNDRLKRAGPLPVPEAVEAALQIMAGLEAAHAAGVLHRDIKPANCFVTAEGTVKVGDFGLSVSTLARGESLLTAAGTVLGTPAYASPEQLRGEELDVRSDLYSVGATLYHLLTGKTPFAATDFVKLITEVLDKPPVAPAAVRAEIPAELSQLVLQCLAKERPARPQTYAELRDALLPFRAVPATPAKPAKRLLAALVDDLAAYLPSLAFLAYWGFDPSDYLARERTWLAGFVWLPFYVWYLAYFTFTEGRWGAGLGKTLCGLRVVGRDGQRPGLLRALARVLVYSAASVLPAFAVMALIPAAEWRARLAREEWVFTDWLWLLLTLGLFVTMRARNGYAALQDLISGTRVVLRPKAESRPTLRELGVAVALRIAERGPADGPNGATGTPAQRRAATRFGPYEAQALLWQRDAEELWLARDAALQRRIWIHLRPANTAAVTSARRDLSRPTRLRWLNGGRTGTNRWEAYEALDGLPLLALAVSPQPWQAVRFWLLDLAEELASLLESLDDAPASSLDRVWISATGRAVLLDFPCPGLPAGCAFDEPMPISDEASLQRFLDRVARVTLEASGGKAGQYSSPPASVRARVPLHAQSFLSGLARGSFEQAEMIVGNLCSLAAKPARITRALRVASLAVVPATVGVLGLVFALMLCFQDIRWQRFWSNTYPDRLSLKAAAEVYSTHWEATEDESASAGGSTPDPGASRLELPEQRRPFREAVIRNRELARVYLVHHFADLITNETFWARPEIGPEFAEAYRDLLRDAVAGQAPPRPEEVQAAERTVPVMVRVTERANRLAPLWVFTGVVLLGPALFALLEWLGCAAWGRSLLLNLFGMAVVDRHGQPASRLRLLWRWGLVWVPAGALGILAGGAALVLASLRMTRSEASGLMALALIVAGAVLALAALVVHTALHPDRGLQDRLAGTWLVPR